MKRFSRVLVLTPTPTHPQDFGNRNRIFNVCRAIKDEGIMLDVLHYPAELDWRGTLPSREMQRMLETWDHVFTVAPSRPLHATALGLDHEIDEWWDPAIGSYLDWLFKVRPYTHFIVNYTWLSRAFLHVPVGVVKILDTHDRFADRRLLLASLGVGAEFFHTTEDQETIALDRADIVLAIKDQERNAFARLTAREIVTLTHAETAKYLPVAPPPIPLARPLRLGFIGARNSVNKQNFLTFLDAIVPAARGTMAALEIVLAGRICEEFRSYEAAELVLMNHVDDVASFYGAVDVVVAPIERSTGLKIKIGEALAFGKPIVALRHAFEGYETTHPMQDLENTRALVRACIELSFDPEPLFDMAILSRVSHRRGMLRFQSTVCNLVAMRSSALCCLVMVSKAICNYRSAAGNRQIDVIRYISYIGLTYIYVVDALTAAELRALEDFTLPGTKVISSHANARDADTAIVVASLADLLAELPIAAIWASAVNDEDMPAFESFTATTIIDMMLYPVTKLGDLPAVRAERRYYAHYPGAIPWEGFWSGVGHDHQMPVPYFINVQSELDESWRLRLEGHTILILSDALSDRALRDVTSSARFEYVLSKTTVISDRDERCADDPPGLLPLAVLATDLRRIGPRPCVCLDLCEDNPAFTFVREMMLRHDVPLISIEDVREISIGETDISRSREILDGCHQMDMESPAIPTGILFQNDAGWCQLWWLMSSLKTG